MCRVNGDSPDAWSVSKPIARKQHKCQECRRIILAGEPYERHSIVYDGTASDHVICAHCAVLNQWIGIQCGGTVCGELIEDIEEHADEYDRSDLRALASCARLQWRCIAADATNPGIPVPALPLPISLS